MPRPYRNALPKPTSILDYSTGIPTASKPSEKIGGLPSRAFRNEMKGTQGNSTYLSQSEHSMTTVMPPIQLEDILTSKRQRLTTRKAKMPLGALRALAGMQRRPEPVLNTVTDDVMIFGQIHYAPDGYDPVMTA